MSLEKAREERARIRTRAFEDAMLYVQTGDDTKVRPLDSGESHAAHPVYLPVLPRLGEKVDAEEPGYQPPQYIGEGEQSSYRRHRIIVKEFEHNGQRGYDVIVKNSRDEVIGRNLKSTREEAVAWGRQTANQNIRVRVPADETRARHISRSYQLGERPEEEAAELARRREWLAGVEPRIHEEQRERARLTGRLRRTETYREMDPEIRRQYQDRIREMSNQELHELNMAVREMERMREREGVRAEAILADRERMREEQSMVVGVPYAGSRMISPEESIKEGRPVTYTKDRTEQDNIDYMRRQALLMKDKRGEMLTQKEFDELAQIKAAQLPKSKIEDQQAFRDEAVAIIRKRKKKDDEEK